MSELDHAFGDLRALMNTTRRSPRWWDDVLDLLTEAFEVSPVVARERWIPYIEGFDAIWSQDGPWSDIRSLEDFEAWPVWMRQLRFSLYLFGSRSGDDAAERIAWAPQSERLHGLNMGRCDLTARGFRALAESPRLRELRHLSLASNSPGGHGVRALMTMPGLSRLERLFLDGNAIGDGVMADLIDAFENAELVELGIRRNKLGLKTLRTLYAHRGLDNLEKLHLDGLKVGRRVALALCAPNRLESLKVLSLSDCHIDERLATSIVEGLELPALEWLYMENRRYTVEFERRLAGIAERRGFEVRLRYPDYHPLG